MSLGQSGESFELTLVSDLSSHRWATSTFFGKTAYLIAVQTRLVNRFPRGPDAFLRPSGVGVITKGSGPPTRLGLYNHDGSLTYHLSIDHILNAQVRLGAPCILCHWSRSPQADASP